MKLVRTPSRRGWDRSERATAGLAAASLAAAGAVIAGQYGRMVRRRAADETDPSSLTAVPAAAAVDTVGVVVQGYQATPRSETVLLNMLAGFLGSFATVRLSTWGMRGGWWPLGNVNVGGRHIHHFVPGILICFGAGTTALLTDNPKIEDRLAIPMGVGMGLTFDEAALLLDLRDVYWTREGLLSVQLSLGVSAILSLAILALRILRRGERRQEEAGAIPVSPSHQPPPFPVG